VRELDADVYDVLLDELILEDSRQCQ